MSRRGKPHSMKNTDLVQLAERLGTIKSIAWVPRVSSTNTLGRLVMNECIENDIVIPEAAIVAGEQYGGRGRGERTWHSPAGNGIYATVMHSETHDDLPLLPLRVPCIVASFLHDTYGIDARIKWPNDILVDGKKIAGILIEARIHDGSAYVIMGVGINVFSSAGAPPVAVSIAELSKRDAIDLETATVAFLEYFDHELCTEASHEEIVERWRALAVHRTGDRISCVVGDETIEGTWAGIDEHGRALVRRGEDIVPVPSGDLILM